MMLANELARVTSTMGTIKKALRFKESVIL
jgi:hypothetical protein